jgi:dTDP-4-dehydrorhamnose reductase
MRVLVLGATGMIGRSVKDRLQAQNVNVITMGRSSVNDIQSDLLQETFTELISYSSEIRPDYILNFAGMIRQNIHNLEDAEKALKLNSLLPSALESLSIDLDTKVITVATDCVFSGSAGLYDENSLKDGNDVYALTKILGEKLSLNTMHVRTSVVGFGSKKNNSLFDWFCSLPVEARCEGYANHFWNGITSIAASKIICGILKNQLFVPGEYHLMPADSVSKYELLQLLKKHYDRPTPRIIENFTSRQINRTLSTLDPKMNTQLWQSAGYEPVPDIDYLISELVNTLK